MEKKFLGDIVKVINHIENKIPKFNFCIIDFNNGAFFVKNNYFARGDDRGYCQYMFNCEVEVIGNIYENKELLEDKNERF